jgi:uncharacterized protein
MPNPPPRRAVPSHLTAVSRLAAAPLLAASLLVATILLVAACAAGSHTPASDATVAEAAAELSGAEAPSPRTAAPRPAAPSEPTDPAGLRTVEVTTVGWDATTTSPVVLLREPDTGQVVPIWVGVAEAQAIAAALLEVPFPRPMTHDLMADLVARLGGRVEELVIHDLVDGTYLGRLTVRPPAGGEPLSVDTRPSDGMALALRSGAAIRVAQKILDETPEVDFLAPDEPEQVVRALGLTVVTPSDTLRAEFSLPEGPGLVVLRAAGQAADRGLRRGDLLLEVDGVAARRPLDFLDAVRDAPLGEELPVRYWRGGQVRETTLLPEAGGDRRKGPRQVA